VQLFAINTIDLYSSGVTLQALGLPSSDGVGGHRHRHRGDRDGLVLFHGDFYHDLTVLPLHRRLAGPWFGILIVDYWLRRGRYDANSLSARAVACTGERRHPLAGPHRQGSDDRVPTVDQRFLRGTVLCRPISSALQGSDLSWLLGIVVGGFVYWVLAGPGEARGYSPLPDR